MDVNEEGIRPLTTTFARFMETAANAAYKKGWPRLTPTFVQDGGAEIHPDLRGISFNFFTNPDPEVHGVAVNYEGEAPNAPWAARLTGFVFEDFTQAKAWLRQESKKLANAHKAERRRTEISREVHDTLST